MVKIFVLKKRRPFDEDADWVPSNGTVCTLKKQRRNQHVRYLRCSKLTPMPYVPLKTRDLPFALAGTPTTHKDGL